MNNNKPTVDLRQLQHDIHAWAVSKGWWEDMEKSFADQVANFHSEISEAWEDYRNNHPIGEVFYEGDKPCGIPTELADTVIRILDTCEHYGIDLAGEIERKMAYNRTRAHRHGGKKA